MTTNRLDALKQYIKSEGWLWKQGKTIPYGEQIIIFARSDQITLDFYPKRGRMVVGGSASPLKEAVQAWVSGDDSTDTDAPQMIPAPHIGLDESGKGDWFGPLVVAAVFIDTHTLTTLQKAGVRDSKELAVSAIQRLAQQIKRIVPASQRYCLSIDPEQYNTLYAQHNNINLLLADIYAQAATQVWQAIQTRSIVCDQFAQRTDRLNHAFSRYGLPRPIQQHHAEAISVGVAAASILASAVFTSALDQLGQDAGLGAALPKGASDMRALDSAARRIIRTQGINALARYAKLNFKPIQALLDSEQHDHR
ncbi:MAG: ribonuclease HIII [Chloroflexales bacterium]|nr:ribonuclease HIII [Chloroflexales bacterium]